MKRQKVYSHSPEETFSFANSLASNIQPPYLIGLSGEIGVGKTVFAKGFANGLRIKELITSPTFLGISESYSGSAPFIHMDFYKKVVKKENIELYLNKRCVVLIEWCENYKVVFNEELNLNACVYIQYVKDKDGNILDNERQILFMLY